MDVFRKNGYIYFKCKCCCKNNTIREVLKASVISNNSKSCGCLITNILIERNSKVNTYKEFIDYISGYDINNNEFMISTEDLLKVKQYYWGKNSRGYFHSTINGKHIMLHRFLFNLSHSNINVDHINHNKSDNRRDNLRICNAAQNLCNSKLNKRNKSGTKGVCFDKRANKWEAYGVLYGKKHHLGRFLDKEEAIKNRKEWEIVYQKDFAYKELD